MKISDTQLIFNQKLFTLHTYYISTDEEITAADDDVVSSAWELWKRKYCGKEIFSSVSSGAEKRHSFTPWEDHANRQCTSAQSAVDDYYPYVKETTKQLLHESDETTASTFKSIIHDVMEFFTRPQSPEERRLLIGEDAELYFLIFT